MSTLRISKTGFTAILLLGDGEIDFAAVRQALLDIHYGGPYVADMPAFDDPMETARRSLAALRRLFN